MLSSLFYGLLTRKMGRLSEAASVFVWAAGSYSEGEEESGMRVGESMIAFFESKSSNSACSSRIWVRFLLI